MEKKQLKLSDFETKMGSEWFGYMKDYIASEEMWELYQKLKEFSKKDKIFPKSNDTFKAFSLCSPKNLKLIIYGMEPYSGIFYDNKEPQADGLCLSNSYSTGKLQPSLISFLTGAANEYETDVDEYLIKDLSFLSTQGVLLLNRSLTVRQSKIGSMIGMWDGFQKFFLENIITSFFPSIPILLLGKDAQVLKKYIFIMSNPIFELEHPSASARNGQLYETNNTFHKINNHIRSTIGDKFEIKWNYTEYTKWISEPPF